jgi:hypothetical protein
MNRWAEAKLETLEVALTLEAKFDLMASPFDPVQQHQCHKPHKDGASRVVRRE